MKGVQRRISLCCQLRDLCDDDIRKLVAHVTLVSVQFGKVSLPLRVRCENLETFLDNSYLERRCNTMISNHLNEKLPNDPRFVSSLSQNMTFAFMNNAIVVDGLLALSLDCLAPADELKRWTQLLQQPKKHQALLMGPSGTGKTFIAEKLAKYLTGPEKKHVKVLTFHQRFSYGEFMAGQRVNDDARVAFSAGILPRFLFKDPWGKAGGTKQNGDDVDIGVELPGPRVLVVDEFNRGNAANVLGECLRLLEYRGKSNQQLLACGKPFYIPESFFLIGTMNSEDRSIAEIDRAMFERFSVLDVSRLGTPSQLLDRWLVLQRFELNELQTQRNWLKKSNDFLEAHVSANQEKMQIGHARFLGEFPSIAQFKTHFANIVVFTILPIVRSFLPGHSLIEFNREMKEFTNQVETEA